MRDEKFFSGSVSVSSDVLVQELPDQESIFLNLRTEEYFGLDSVGTTMYRALVEAGSVHAAHDRLLEQFHVTPETLRRDLSALVERLAHRGLIELSEA